jgi:hypothetical protein
MQLEPYVDDVARQLALTADAAGPEARALAERLTLPLHAALRLALLDALSAAADELTLDLAPGSVEVRLRGGDPRFVVQGVAPTALDHPVATAPADPPTTLAEADDAPSTRINLRMSDALKARVEAAALAEGRSVNAWLVRAATAALPGATPAHPAAAPLPPMARGARRVTGWSQ